MKKILLLVVVLGLISGCMTQGSLVKTDEGVWVDSGMSRFKALQMQQTLKAMPAPTGKAYLLHYHGAFYTWDEEGLTMFFPRRELRGFPGVSAIH